MSRPVCAVDFTTNSLNVLVRRASGEIEATTAALPEEAIADGKILQPVAVQLFLTRMLKDLLVTKAEIRVCLSDSACVSRFVDFPKMPPRDLERSMHFEAARELPVSPSNAYLGWQVLEEHENRRRVLLVAAWRDVVEGYLLAVEGLGRVTVVEPRAIALARAVGLPDSTLVEWADDRLQVTQVQGRLVQYTTSVVVKNGAAKSSDQLLRLVSGLLPNAGGWRPTPASVVLLGKLHGRDDVEAELRAVAGSDITGVGSSWVLAEPYREFVDTAQMANVGLLMGDWNG